MKLPHGHGENFNNYGHERDSSAAPIHDAYSYERDHGPVKLSTPPTPPCHGCGTFWNVFGNHTDASGKVLWLCEGCEVKEMNLRALELLAVGMSMNRCIDDEDAETEMEGVGAPPAQRELARAYNHAEVNGGEDNA